MASILDAPAMLALAVIVVLLVDYYLFRPMVSTRRRRYRTSTNGDRTLREEPETVGSGIPIEGRGSRNDPVIEPQWELEWILVVLLC